MDDTPSRDSTIDSASCSSYPLQRRPSMIKRLRRSLRRAVSNKEEVLASESNVLRPSLSAEMLDSPEAFTEEPCSRRRSASNRMTFSATTLWDNLVSYLETNVNPGTRRRSLRMYNNCFFGHEAVNCLHKYITTSLSRQCDRDQVSILCHRFLVLGIIEDAKCAPEADKDFNTGLLYRLTSQKKFWELACLKSEDEESDSNYKEEESSVTLSCLSDDCKKAAEEENSDKCSENMQQRSLLGQSLLKSTPKVTKPSRNHELTVSTEEHSDDHELHSTVIKTSDNSETKQHTLSSLDVRLSSTNDADSSSSSVKGRSEVSPLTVQKPKKSFQTRKRRWHSIKEKSHKTGNKQAHLIPHIKTRMSLRRKKQNVSGSETNDKHWIAFGYI